MRGQNYKRKLEKQKKFPQYNKIRFTFEEIKPIKSVLMANMKHLSDAFNQFLKEKVVIKTPVNLYEPIHYILDLGGKRIRPVLVLLITDLFSNDYKKALSAALAVEVFHNFTLMHDDIMDSASMRRGKETVHTKWNLNTGILSGDAMLIKAYQFIEDYPDVMYRDIMKVFNKTALEVCEGQQYDVDFEGYDDVSIENYIEMIRLKTAVLLAAALEIGAIIGDASANDRKHIYQFGLNLGIAFQIQDDYLDTFGDEKSFGKKIGGDILEQKKTYLYITALQKSSIEEQQQLKKMYDSTDSISKVTAFFTTKKVPEVAKKAIEDYTKIAFSHVEKLSISDVKKQQLVDFGMNLMNRTV